jgi:branched-chain amino acid transport system substrate-binding protein
MKLVRLLLAAALLVAPASPVRAADPVVVNVILPLTGSGAFLGNTMLQSLKGVEGYINRTGGIAGRPLSFVAADDQTDPKNALLLAQGLIAKGVPIILGSTTPQACAAIAPLVLQDGPLLYCLTNAGTVVPGSYELYTQPPNDTMLNVVVRYFRLRGFHRLATIFATDGGGLDTERGLAAVLALPENKDMQVVDNEHFGTSDMSVAAQMTRIKAANPNVLIAWATGTPAGTLFRNARDAGLDVPTLTSPGNLNANFFKQYSAIVPSNLYFAAGPYYADAMNDAPMRSAFATMTSSLAVVGAKPDMIAVGAWDPGMLVATALRKFGPNATAAQLRTYLTSLRGWVGVNGTYDFRTNPQHGVGMNSVLVIRVDDQGAKFTPVSKTGGIPLPDSR